MILRSSVPFITIVFFFITVLCLIISGCGGGSSNTVVSQIPPVSPSTGSLEVKANWPEEGLSAQLIPEDTVKIEIVITGIPSPITVTLPEGVNSKTITDIPAGDVQLEFKALDANGKILAHRITGVKVISGQTVSVNVILGITILSTGFVPSSITVNVGDVLYFVNNDNVPHTLVLEGLTNSGPVPPGGEYAFYFTGKPSKNYSFTCDRYSCTVTVTGGADPVPTEVPVAPANPQWKNVGTEGFSAGKASYTSLYVYDGTPYVAYSDFANGDKATVMKFDDPNWTNVGTAGFSAGGSYDTSLYVYDGTPYVAYRDWGNGGEATVMKFDGTNWNNVGDPGFSAGQARYTSLYVSNGTPYVAYMDWANGNKATVMKFNGASWTTVGTAGFSAGAAAYTSLYIYDGIPYVAYRDGANGNKATVMKFTN